jgi:Tol biopolymer transport system component
MTRHHTLILTLAVAAGLAAGATQAAVPKAARPVVFAPGVISGPAYDASPAFAPDGNTVYFTVATPASSTIMKSQRTASGWSSPRPASFSSSGHWNNLEPAMAPDGSFIVFASNRPISTDGKPIDGFFSGKQRPGRGGNLWRVDREGGGWGTPRRLPATINGNTSTFSPAVAGDGSVYFMQADSKRGYFHLWRSALAGGTYQAPVRLNLGDADSEEVDPVVAPDESFIVYSLRHPQAKDNNRLHIAFREGDGWGTPQDLGDAINGDSGTIEARLGRDGQTLYFSSSRHADAARPDGTPAPRPAWDNGKSNIWSVSLAPWLHRR